jgi:hypothetical protein
VLPGKASTSPASSSWRWPATTISTRPSRRVKYSRVPGRCGVPPSPASGAKSLGRRLGNQRPLGDAPVALPRADFLDSPLAHLGARRSEQLVDRDAERACHLDQDGEGRIGLARFQVGDRRSRQPRGGGEGVLRHNVRACRRLIRLCARCRPARSGPSASLSIASTFRQPVGQQRSHAVPPSPQEYRLRRQLGSASAAPPTSPLRIPGEVARESAMMSPTIPI